LPEYYSEGFYLIKIYKSLRLSETSLNFFIILVSKNKKVIYN